MFVLKFVLKACEKSDRLGIQWEGGGMVAAEDPLGRRMGRTATVAEVAQGTIPRGPSASWKAWAE